MRTTVILDDLIYQKLVNKAVSDYGNAKSLSKALNAILSRALAREEVPQSMFGAWKGEKGLSTKGLREEGEPH